jgi:photosynthetic reaction center cytochrome c subunit
MQAITAWIAPKEGCAYCHDLQNLAADTKYTKVVSRRMLEMTRHVNASWTSHVRSTGVTCWTCHRGNHVPQQTWFDTREPLNAFAGRRDGQDAPAPTAAFSALPNATFANYLAGADNIRVVGEAALPSGSGPSVQVAEHTYGLMMHFSQALGVNCTYCHNSRSFQNWDQSTPQRVTAWHGIRMVRELNNDYLGPLASVFPPQRRGPLGDTAKVSCATCHQGAFKPLYGAAMAKQYPGLEAPTP